MKGGLKMQAYKFTLSGKTAFFKKPEMNAFFYFTYGQIHKIALLGLFGAILGLDGYNKQAETKTDFPEFYEKLHNLKIAISPQNSNGYINKKMQTFNNSTGFASYESGGNLIVKEQWLENPVWDIYILVEDNEQTKLLIENLQQRKTTYHLYLGKNDHFANISNGEYVDLANVMNGEEGQIASLCLREDIKTLQMEEDDDLSAEPQENIWQYEEMLPTTLSEETNHYQQQQFILTNATIKIMNNADTFFKLTKTGKIIQFIK